MPDDFRWVIVDDGSTDGTRAIAEELAADLPVRVVHRIDGGTGLATGSAFAAWRHGVEQSVADGRMQPDRVMKLDADVVLPADYFLKVARAIRLEPDVGLVGGLIGTQGSREQALHVPGALKNYSWAAYLALESLPTAVGFDVMDEVALALHGFKVRILRDAPVQVRRRTGSSEGLIRGRRRNGRVVRWTGYHPVYAALHIVRYFFRRPHAIGAMAMVKGIAESGPGPYPSRYKRAHADQQMAKLKALMKNPIAWIERTYR